VFNLPIQRAKVFRIGEAPPDHSDSQSVL